MRARTALRGVGDANQSRTLDGECAGDEEFRTSASIRRHPRRMSRNGTDESEPLWNGPTLRPAFVAQVLGQVMMESSASAPACAYAQVAQIAPGSFVDDAL